MPHIDKFSVKEKYRAWDSDILSKLKMSDDNQLPNKTDKDNRISDKKVMTNRGQTSDKAETNRRQTDDNVVTAKEELVTKYRQTTPQTSDTTNDKVMTNQRQTADKTSFYSLTGLQRCIAILIYNLCKLSRDKKTKEVSIIQLAHCCNSTIKSIKRSVFRLIEKGIILRDSFKNGRGGWTVYCLPNEIYQEIMSMETDNKLMTNWRQTDDKLPTQLPPELVTQPSSSSSLNILKTTTTENNQNSNKLQQHLSVEWQEIDIEPLSVIGFTKNHLTQIAFQLKLLPATVQESIHAFAFDLEENDKRKTIAVDPISFFMGILRKSGRYIPPHNYESPQERYMRLYAERMGELEAKREAIEKRAFDLAFWDWFGKLTDEKKRELLPANFRVGARLEKNKMLEGEARNYFKMEVWADVRNKIKSGEQTLEVATTVIV